MSRIAARHDGQVTGLTCDSRAVRPGFLFAALPGSKTDGREFIPEAIRRGATVVLTPPGEAVGPDIGSVRHLSVENPRRLFALMAARFHARQPEVVAAVTGTNGKTSVVWFLRQLWAAAGRDAGCLGTLGVESERRKTPGSLTTPDPVALHETLADLADLGIERLAMEASSHGLAQYRLDGVRIAAAGFTNLTRDHLDFHGTMDGYRAAKERLFANVLQPDGAAVLNADSDHTEAFRIAAASRVGRIMTYGRKGTDIHLRSVTPSATGQCLDLVAFGERRRAVLPVVGEFQAFNALCALGLAVACGENPERMIAAFETLTPPPGRLQEVARHPNGAPVYVDYAHTPDALEVVLKALRPHAAERLIVVFGCGGDRDRGKRPQMGRIAARLADLAIVTDDNPRSEDPTSIRAEIMAACSGGREIGERAEAIREGVAALNPGDVLVVAGKGHETGQIVGTEVRPFSDADAAREAVRGVEE